MAPYTSSKVTIEPGYYYAPYIPINIVSSYGTPWFETKRKFAWWPKKTTSGRKLWLKFYVRWQKIGYGPIDFPPGVQEEKIFTDKEYVWWRLQQKD